MINSIIEILNLCRDWVVAFVEIKATVVEPEHISYGNKEALNIEYKSHEEVDMILEIVPDYGEYVERFHLRYWFTQRYLWTETSNGQQAQDQKANVLIHF